MSGAGAGWSSGSSGIAEAFAQQLRLALTPADPFAPSKRIRSELLVVCNPAGGQAVVIWHACGASAQAAAMERESFYPCSCLARRALRLYLFGV